MHCPDRVCGGSREPGKKKREEKREREKFRKFRIWGLSAKRGGRRALKRGGNAPFAWRRVQALKTCGKEMRKKGEKKQFDARHLLTSRRALHLETKTRAHVGGGGG
jgi:hypothetical protein